MTYDIRKKIPLLEKTKGEANKYKCPSCGGSNLHIMHSALGYKCYNGCESAAVREAIDRLEGKEPWKPEPTWVKPSRAVATTFYHYNSRDGKPLVRVRRIDQEGEPKNVRPLYLSDAGKWVLGCPSELYPDLPIYNYAKVQEAIARQELIWFVEGEATADALSKIGLCATTTIGGAQSFKSRGDYTKDFDGASVVLCPDRDAAGLAYMADAAELLGNRVIGYYLVGSPGLWRNPEGGMDLVDELADFGYTPDQLFDRIKSVEEFKQLTAQLEPKEVLPAAATGLISDPLITELQWRDFAEARSIDPVEYDPRDYFPSRLAEMMLRDAECQCVDPMGYAAYLMPTVLSLMGHTSLDVGGYTIPNIMWTLLIQDSGTGKTRIDKLVKKKLLAWDKEEKVLYDQKSAEYQLNQAMTKNNRNFSEGFSLPPLRRRFVVGDASVAAVSALICENDQTAFLWTKDEFNSLLKDLSKRSGHDGGDKETLLELWGGGEVIIDRIDKSRSMMATSSRVSIVGGMQPDVFLETFNPKDPQGFLARFLPFSPEPREKIAKRTSPEMIQELPAIYTFIKGARGSNWQTIKMSDETWNNCWAPIYNYLGSLKSNLPAYQNWLNKSADHVGRVALALHSIECYYDQSKALFEITEDTLARAYALTLMCMNNVKNICHRMTSISELDSPNLSPILLKIIKKLGDNPEGLQLRDIYQGVRGIYAVAKEEQTTSATIARRCCEELASKGFIRFDGKFAKLVS